jgi:hypothetical protein
MSHIISQERQGFWIAVSFIVALLALALALSAMWRLNMTLVASQAEMMILNSKIEAMKMAPPAVSAAMPAADSPK